MGEPQDELTVTETVPGIENDELKALRKVMAEMPDGGNELLSRLMPSTDTAWLHEQVNRGIRHDVPGVELHRKKVKVNEASLQKFCAENADALNGVKLSVDEVSSVKFQGKEEWYKYLTAPGAARYHALGMQVEAPMWRSLDLPALALSHDLRPEHDPAKAPLRLGLFADFGNGLYHAHAIARQLAKAKLPYVFHLGDVYYGGSEKEFQDYFTQPLAPVIENSELFILAGNHEMYARGVYFQKYIRDKHAAYPELQRQNGEMFRVVGSGLQLIGIDTMFTDWVGGKPRVMAQLGNPEKDVLTQWLADVGPDTLTVLLTSDHPWDFGKFLMTPLYNDLKDFIKKGQIDLWFWGNVHYAALYKPWQDPESSNPGFIGSCIGHGGYPYYTQSVNDLPQGVGLEWLEQRNRFAPYKDLRPDVGMNGWCEMEVHRQPAGWSVKLRYVDWVGRQSRLVTLFKPHGGGIDFTGG